MITRFSICQCVILSDVHVYSELMFFSTNIQPIDQQKKLTVPIFFVQWLYKKSKLPPRMTK